MRRAAAGGRRVSENLFAISGDKRVSIPLREVEIAPGYFHLLDARFVAGGEPEISHRTSYDAHRSAVLNRAAVRALHLTSARMAVGRTLDGARRHQIVAVIANMRFGSPHATVPPTIYTYDADLPGTPLALVRTSQPPRQTMPAMRKAWQEVAPDIAWNAHSARALLSDSLRNDLRMTWLLAIGTLLSSLTAAIGPWAMTVMRLVRHARAIAMRRRLGATSRELARGLMRGFLRPVLIGSFIAMPVAFFVMRILLASFDDRVEHAAVLLPVAAVFSVVAGFCTVVGPILYVLATPPGRALRHE